MPSLISVIQNKEVILPNKEELLKIMRVVEGSPEAAKYFEDRFVDVVRKSKAYNTSESQKTIQEVVSAINDFVTRVGLKYNVVDELYRPRTDEWRGEMPSTESENLQFHLEANAKKEILSKEIKRFQFDYAISEAGQFIRGYASAEEGASSLDQTTIESLDKYLAKWLREKDITYDQEGYFFKAEGSVNRKLSVAEIEELMAAEDDFQSYVKEVGIEMIGRQCEYPEEYRLKERQEKIKLAAQEALKVAEAEKLGVGDTELEPEKLAEKKAEGTDGFTPG